MKVKKILSNLNAWNLLNNTFKQEITDVMYSIERVDISSEQNLRAINSCFMDELIKF